ncbi:hypothetical protein RZS08_38285, partial [Arthrospira platensis SPKY1]|nr:hypothetical protein [Arthrospira platensis SPKY1]
IYPQGVPTLGDLLRSHLQNDKHLNEFRTSLLTRIADSQRLQHQLNSLLAFAREHIEQTLQRVYDLNRGASTRYDQKGRKSSEDRSIFSRYA